MADTDEIAVLKLVARKLQAAGIPYMVTGSMAMTFYGKPRFTRDVDIVVELSAPDVNRIASLFEDDFSLDKEALAQAVRSRGLFNMIHKATILKVDFIIRKSGEYRKVEFSRRREVSFEGEKVFLTAPEDLILSKLLWAKEGQSAMQMEDARNLLRSAPSLDRSYLERWVKALDLEDLYRKAST